MSEKAANNATTMPLTEVHTRAHTASVPNNTLPSGGSRSGRVGSGRVGGGVLRKKALPRAP